MRKLEILNATIGSKDGRLGIRIPADRQVQYNDMLAYCGEKKGSYISIILHPPRKPRTTGYKSQNHHFNSHCVQIAQEVGEDFDVVKMEIKKRAIKRGYPTRTTKFHDLIPISESEASTVDCGHLIDQAHEVADFLGMKLKENNDE